MGGGIPSKFVCLLVVSCEQLLMSRNICMDEVYVPLRKPVAL